MYYWLVLLGLVLFYATGIFTLKYVRKTAVCNLLFPTGTFLLYGNHNIYNFVVCENGYLSAAIYFCGLCGIFTVGYFYQKLLKKI